ncbi:DUF6887 family protein [Geminocystis sp. CENA526]|uniref:DUF6887 family protein n=1 Tax=Geminocystis sp. CENA526 TaxID=1355871 RepID=UPI003D6F2F28
MDNINYSTMSDQELREYFLANRDNQLALQAYLERKNSQPRKIIATVGDTDFDTKIESAIQKKLKVLPKSQ